MRSRSSAVSFCASVWQSIRHGMRAETHLCYVRSLMFVCVLRLQIYGAFAANETTASSVYVCRFCDGATRSAAVIASSGAFSYANTAQWRVSDRLTCLTPPGLPVGQCAVSLSEDGGGSYRSVADALTVVGMCVCLCVSMSSVMLGRPTVVPCLWLKEPHS